MARFGASVRLSPTLVRRGGWAKTSLGSDHSLELPKGCTKIPSECSRVVHLFIEVVGLA